MASFTKNEIKKSFLKLLDERPLSSITIKNIVDDCKINRSSFYYHFQDIPALLEEIVQESTDAVIRQFPSLNSVSQCLDAMMQYLISQRRMALHVYRSVSRDVFEKQLIRTCNYFVTKYAEASLNDEHSPQDRSFIIQYYKYLLLGFATNWLESGLDEGMANEFRQILQSRAVTGISYERELREPNK